MVADDERRVVKAEPVVAAAVSSPAPEAEALAHGPKRRRRKSSGDGRHRQPARGAAVGALGTAARSSTSDAQGTEAAKFPDLAGSSRADALVNASSTVAVLAQTQSRICFND